VLFFDRIFDKLHLGGDPGLFAGILKINDIAEKF